MTSPARRGGRGRQHRPVEFEGINYTGRPWMGQPITSDTRCWVRYTYYGDSNLDGRLTLWMSTISFKGLTDSATAGCSAISTTRTDRQPDVTQLIIGLQRPGASPLGDAMHAGQAQVLLSVEQGLSAARFHDSSSPWASRARVRRAAGVGAGLAAGQPAAGAAGPDGGAWVHYACACGGRGGCRLGRAARFQSGTRFPFGKFASLTWRPFKALRLEALRDIPRRSERLTRTAFAEPGDDLGRTRSQGGRRM